MMLAGKTDEGARAREMMLDDFPEGLASEKTDFGGRRSLPQKSSKMRCKIT